MQGEPLQPSARKRYDAPMPFPAKPWWEWSLFVFAVLGAIKSFLWDWLIDPLLKRPKLVGEIDDVRLVTAGVARNVENSKTQETAFDSELRLHVSIHNKRAQPTYLKQWALEVRTKGIGKIVLPSFIPEKDRRWRINGPLMPEQIEFSWKKPYEGWLYFRYPNRSSRSLEKSRYSLLAIDVDGRKHQVHCGVVPNSGVGLIARNAVQPD